MNPLRQVHRFLEQAVEAVPDEDALLHGLDVDVAGSALDRALHDEIDQVDDRRGFAALFQPGDRLEHFLFGTPRKRRLAGRDLDARPAGPPRGRGRSSHREIAPPGRRRAHQRLVRIAGLDGVDDVAARGDDLLDAVACLELQILNQAEEERIGHRDRQQVLFQPDGDAHTLERNLFGNQNNSRRIGRVLGEVDVRESELERQRLRDLLFSREVHAHENDTHAFSGTLMFCQRLPEVVFSDKACLNQAFTDFLAHQRPSGE